MLTCPHSVASSLIWSKVWEIDWRLLIFVTLNFQRISSHLMELFLLEKPKQCKKHFILLCTKQFLNLVYHGYTFWCHVLYLHDSLGLLPEYCLKTKMAPTIQLPLKLAISAEIACDDIIQVMIIITNRGIITSGSRSIQNCNKIHFLS